MAPPTALAIAAEFSDAVTELSASHLVVLLDDYKAMLRNAAVAGQKDVYPWMEDRIHRLSEAYADAQRRELGS